MRKVFIFLFFGVLITSCSQKKNSQLEWIPFAWVSDSVSGKYFEKIAIFIPVTIDELPQKFTMQFDLGAVTTVFYGKTIKPFLEKYSTLSNKLDTTKAFWINSVKNPMFGNVNLQLGKFVFKDISVGLYSDYGDDIRLDSINSKTEIPIGTIASDLFQNKILIIDYKSNRLAVADTLPSEYQSASFEDCIIKDGRIKIPLQINGKTEYLLFDTGSSIFSLSTTKHNALEIGGNKITDSLTIPSWGKQIPFYGLKTIIPIKFGNKDLGSSNVYYTEEESFEYLYQSENIWGLTGNAFFLNDVVIIDYKNNRFGVK